MRSGKPKETARDENILTKHPAGKHGRNIDRAKYDVLSREIQSLLRTGELSHQELFSRLNENLRDTFDGNINWYGETVKLDLEARKIIKRTPTKPQRYLLVKK